MDFKNTKIYQEIQKYFLPSAPKESAIKQDYMTQSPDNTFLHTSKDIRPKEVTDWLRAMVAATDPYSPDRSMLYHVYENLMRDEQLQSVTDNRTLALQQATFLIKKDGKRLEDTEKLIKKMWFLNLEKMYIKAMLQGTTVIDLTKELTDSLEIKKIEEVPQGNICAPAGVVLFQEGDQQGTPYKRGGLETYFVQIGDDWDLGILNELAIVLFAKKLGFGAWINYMDLYGIPPLFATTNRMDAQRTKELQAMLEGYRSAHYGVLKGDEKVEIGNDSSGSKDQFKPYIEMCKQIIAQRILGQTGTTEKEGYVGTAQVHETVEKLRKQGDKLFFKYFFESEIIPRLVKISPVYASLDGCELEWDDRETMTLKDFITALKDLAYTFDFDAAKVAEYTGLPITGIKEMTQAGTTGVGGDGKNGKAKEDTTKKAKADARSTAIVSLYSGAQVEVANADFTLSDKIRDRVLQRISEKGYDPNAVIDSDLFEHTQKAVDEATTTGFGVIAKNSPDYGLLQQLRYSSAVFAAFKAHDEQKELHAELFTDAGKRKDFNTFRQDAQKIVGDYNVNWLQTEYNTAMRRASFASDFQRFYNDRDLFPNLMWLPSVSVNKREAHRAFYNMVRPIDDPFWSTNYPGMLWECKCSVTSTSDPVDKKGSDLVRIKADAGLDESPYDGSLFTRSHPYFDEQGNPIVQRTVDAFLTKYSRDTVRSDFKEKLQGKSIVIKPDSNPDQRIEMSYQCVKKITSKPSSNPYLRNQSLYDIENAMNQGEYMGWSNESKEMQVKHHNNLKWHYYKIALGKDSVAYANVVETKDGKFRIEAIKDGIDLDKIKKAQ